MLQAFTIPSPATPKEHPRLPLVRYPSTQRCSSDRDSSRRTIRRTSGAQADGRAVHKQADERRISDASAMHQRCTRDRATARGTRDARVTEEQMDERCTSRWTSDGPAERPAMDQRWTSDGPAERPAMDQRCTSDESSRRTHDARGTEEQPDEQTDARWTSDGPAMHERQSNTQTNDGRASHGPRLEQTRERRTMDDREMRQLYHHRLERLVEIAPNSHRYACCTCFASAIHTEEEDLHSHKLHRDKGTIDDGIHAIPHGLELITAISSIRVALLPFQSLHYVQAIHRIAMDCKAVQLQLQSLLNSQ